MFQRRVLPTFAEDSVVIGNGATASVYRRTVVNPGGFKKLKSGDCIAVKVLHAVQLSSVPLIEREVAMHKALNHPCIVRCYGCFVPPDSHTSSSNSSTGLLTTRVNLLLELCEGGSLELTKLPLHEIAACLHRALRALAYLHRNDIVHRDIKGANLLRTRDGLCKLGDFGAATELGGPRRQFESVKGTINWMAPELFEGSGGTTAADIWSLGATAWELATGAQPFPQCAAYQVVYFVEGVKDDSEFFTPETTAGMPGVVLDFVQRCLKRDPTCRPTAKELLSHPLFAELGGAEGEHSAGASSSDDPNAQSAEHIHQLFASITAQQQLQQQPPSMPPQLRSSSSLPPLAPAAATVALAASVTAGGEEVVPQQSPGAFSHASSDEEASIFADAIAWWQTSFRSTSCSAVAFFTALGCPDLGHELLPLVTFGRAPGRGLSAADNSCVTMGEFIAFVHWFGPFSVLAADARALGSNGYASYGDYYGNYTEAGDAPRVLPTWHSKPWLKPLMSKEDAETHLKRAPPGSFVIRFSGQWRESPGSYTLSMKGDRGVTHHRITRPRGSWSYSIHANSKVPRRYFDNLEDLVAYYQVVGLHNVKGDKTYTLVV